jgi:hypothetical protein
LFKALSSRDTNIRKLVSCLKEGLNESGFPNSSLACDENDLPISRERDMQPIPHFGQLSLAAEHSDSSY